MKAWNGYTLVCGCGSENIESAGDDENYGSMEDYAKYKCLDCGKEFKIELPN